MEAQNCPEPEFEGRTPTPARTIAASGALALLAACGGGKKSASTASAAAPPPPVAVTPAPAPAPTPAPTPTPSPAPAQTARTMTEQQASRFLHQATNGATRPDIDALAVSSIDAWLTAQFAMPRSQSHWSWMKARGFDADEANAKPKGQNNWDCSIWHQVISAPDQLRQRVGLALLDTMVVSVEALDMRWPQFAMAAYMDILLDHAFGDFRKLLGAITTNAAMGTFLTFLGSRRANTKGALPDENYARELLQLFTIGLHELNQNGTLRTDASGQPVETYGQEDIKQLAQVFTGLRLASSDLSNPEPLRQPLVVDGAWNETGPASFLGHTVSGGGMQAIDAALDVIFNHPNIPPFVSRALIQRLVTSNPSSSYIERVANVFGNDGHGARGNLRAVVYAILTDPEARSDLALAAPHAGKLRDPVQRLTNWARAFDVTSPDGSWRIGDKSSATNGLNQSPGRSPSVFNFFRPGYAPPNSELMMRGLVSPELQITDEQSIVGYVNSMSVMIGKSTGSGDVTTDYARIMPKAADAAALVEELNLVLAAGQLSPATQGIIKSAVESINPDKTGGPDKRVKTAILLTLASPDYLILK